MLRFREVSLVVLLSISIMFTTLFLLAVPFALGQSDIPLSPPFQDVLDGKNDDLYKYPTDFTQGIMPKTLHSHNDYWRPKPFYSALSAGAVSVEADVWLMNDTLYVSWPIVIELMHELLKSRNKTSILSFSTAHTYQVGHEESALTYARTFDSLYIQPILSVLKGQNPMTPFVTVPTQHGVFDTDAGQTLYLWVDVKTDGEKTFPTVVKALEPLREGGWLTKFNGSAITQGQVTVIATGNSPLDQIQGVEERDYFWDAQLDKLNTTQQNITSDVTLIASASFKAQFGWPNNGTLNSTMMAKLRSQISVAKERGIGFRYWVCLLTLCLICDLLICLSGNSQLAYWQQKRHLAYALQRGCRPYQCRRPRGCSELLGGPRLR